MYLYLGQDTVINTKEVVGIFDLDNTTSSKITKSYLAKAQKAGQIVEVSAELPKSFVVCENENKVNIYLSQISPSTLRKRTEFIKEIGL